MAENSEEKIRVLVVDDIPETRENLRKILYFETDIEFVGAAINGEEGIQMARELWPHVILMDINMPGMDGITASEVIREEVPVAQVIMMSVQGEADYLRRSMLAGAKEFLIKPFSSDELFSSIHRVYEEGAAQRARYQAPPVSVAAQRQPPPPEELGKVISVFSFKGGTGCSTIATNVAIALQMGTEAKVVLVDGSLQSGDIAVLLNLKPIQTIADLVPHVNELDAELINSVVVPHSSGVKILLAPPRPEMADLIVADNMKRILEELKKTFDLIIVDTWTSLHDLVLTIMDVSDRIVLITTPDIPSLKNTKLFLEVAEVLGYPPEKVFLAVNKADRRSSIRAGDIEAGIKHSVAATLAYDEQVALRAANRGEPFVLSAANSSIAQGMVNLAHQLLDTLIEKEEKLAHRFRFSRSASKIVSAIQSLEELQGIERLEAYTESTTLGRAIDNLEDMISGIPHDLKEPLGIARNTLDDLSEISSPVIGAKDIVYCKDRLDYALLLVNRLISITSCGELEVRTKTSLTEALELVCSLIKSNLQSAVPIDLDIEGGDSRIQVKDSDLQQIILCLLENAVEATPESGTVRVIVEENSTGCHIKVLDFGSGIEGPSALLYTPGHTTKPGHAGLGLFVCRRIVAQYSGKLSVSNREDTQGVMATVVLPKKFKQREKQYRIEDLRENLQHYRNLALSSRKEHEVRDVITRVLTVFVSNLSSIVEDVESVISAMLKQTAQDVNKEQVSLLRTVLRNCAYARAVVRGLLEPSQPMQVQPTHLGTALFDVLRLFETKLPRKSVSLRVDNSIWIIADQIQFQRVFFNLTRNALEAMRLQGKFALGVEAHVEDDFAVIRFSDSGIGIPSENIKKIFDRGFSTKEKGRGLGLFVAKTIVEQHQGRTEVQSEVGVGTRFTIYWPVAPQPADGVAVYPISEVLAGHALFKFQETGNKVGTHPTAIPKPSDLAQILIVEDDSTWLGFLTRRLQSPHYTIHKTRRAGEAIELIRKNRYNLVLLDWRMPGIGGEGILEAAQDVNPDVPIIILSAYGDAEQRSRALQLGARAFIDKPQNKQQWDALKHIVFETVTSETRRLLKIAVTVGR